MGKNIYILASLQMHIVNQWALLSQYAFVNWTTMSKFMDQLPEASKEEFRACVAEGCLVARISL